MLGTGGERVSGGGDRSEYEQWNTALAARYFHMGNAGRPAYLAVDDDELVAAAAEHALGTDRPAERLADAVRAELRSAGSPFWPLVRRARAWRREGAVGIPPYIALLGLFALAGSRMGSDDRAGVATNAYYPRLNQLLGRDQGAGMPEGFDRLWWLWDDLNAWLDTDRRGQLGRATARTHPHFTNIGWPLSQCLLRAADRRRLPDFFRSARLEPGAEVGHLQLWVLFRNWARAGGGLSERARRMIDGAAEHLAEQIAAIVARELETWDGELRDALGRRRAEIALLARKRVGGRHLSISLIARRPEGFPEGAWALPDGRRLELAAAGPGWYRPLELPLTSRHLREGVSLGRADLALALEPSLVIPLRASLEPVAGWVSARQAQAVEEHLVLAHASVLPDLRDFLGRHAQHGWREASPAGDLPSGWVAFSGVRMTAAVTTAPPAFGRLAPRLNTATHLEGGLEIAPRQYLTGGEPDLWITVAPGEECDVEIDGDVERFRAGVIPLRLSVLALPPGSHQVRAGGMARNFTSFHGFPTTAPAGTGCLGHRIERHGTYRPTSPAASELPPGGVPRGHVHLAGAVPSARPEDLPTRAREPILLRTGFDYTLLGSNPGEVQHILPPPAPGWLRGLGLGERVQFFDHPSPFAVQWVVRRRGLAPQLTALARDPAPPGSPARGAHASEWAHAIRRAGAETSAPEGHEASWEEYEHAANTILGGRDAAG